jgi:hypothetical protein
MTLAVTVGPLVAQEREPIVTVLYTPHNGTIRQSPIGDFDVEGCSSGSL